MGAFKIGDFILKEQKNVCVDKVWISM